MIITHIVELYSITRRTLKSRGYVSVITLLYETQ